MFKAGIDKVREKYHEEIGIGLRELKKIEDADIDLLKKMFANNSDFNDAKSMGMSDNDALSYAMTVALQTGAQSAKEYAKEHEIQLRKKAMSRRRKHGS